MGRRTVSHHIPQQTIQPPIHPPTMQQPIHQSETICSDRKVHPYREQLLQQIWASWATKGSKILDVVRNAVKDDRPPNEITGSLYDPANKWMARQIDVPRQDLLNIKDDNIPPAELAILNTLRNHMTNPSDSRGWFQNMHEPWTSKNNGLSDQSNVLVGNFPEALLMHDEVNFGFMLIGPNNLYPPHKHSEDENYHVLAGEAYTTDMQQNDATEEVASHRLHKRVAGDIVTQSAHRWHMLITKDQPILVFWVQVGDFSSYDIA